MDDEANMVWNPPDLLCWDKAAPFELTLFVTCPHGKCSYGPIEALVTLPVSLDYAEIDMTNPDTAPFKFIGPQKSGTIPNWYWMWVYISKEWKRNIQVVIGAHLSQYRGKIRIEENFHAKQFAGAVSFEEGGCRDLFTSKGIRFAMGAAEGRGPFVFGGSTPDEAELSARRVVWEAFDTEIEESTRLINLRRCLMEKVAKERAAYREAYTLCCTYDECCKVKFPPWPPKHSANP